MNFYAAIVQARLPAWQAEVNALNRVGLDGFASILCFSAVSEASHQIVEFRTRHCR
jgi:hypothetical protein